MKQNNEKVNKVMHKFVGVLDRYEEIKYNIHTPFLRPLIAKHEYPRLWAGWEH